MEGSNRERDYRDADLPRMPGRFRDLVGPGAVLVGLAVGAGELIVWPRVTAQYGATMTWAAVLGVFVQLWLNLEIGRYTLATGESVYAGYRRVWHWFSWIFLGLNVVGWIVPGWARTCGGALKVLIVGPDGPGSPTVWTTVTFAAVAAVLFGPRAVYRSMELTVQFLVVVITLGLVAIAFTVSDADTWVALGRGMINFPFKDPDMAGYELFSALVFAGAGGTANLFFSFYLLDKGWGMGARAPGVVNPLRGKGERDGGRCYRIRDTPENRERWSAWIRHLTLDQTLFFWFLNTFTILLFIVGSLAVLHPRGIVPQSELLVWEEATILASLWGGAGKTVFLVVGVACLFSTQLTLIDGVARSCADILQGSTAWARRRSTAELYGAIAALWIGAGIALTYAYEAIPPFMFLLSAGFFGGIAMAIYAPLTLWINLRLLPEPFRPSRARVAILVVVSAMYVAFAIAATINVLRSLL